MNYSFGNRFQGKPEDVEKRISMIEDELEQSSSEYEKVHLNKFFSICFGGMITFCCKEVILK